MGVQILTVVLLVQTLEDQPQLLLVVPEVVDKLLEVQLPVQVFVPGLQDLLKHRDEQERRLRGLWTDTEDTRKNVDPLVQLD